MQACRSRPKPGRGYETASRNNGPARKALHAFDNRMVGTPYSAGSRRYFPLIDTLPDGKLHVMHRQDRFVRRSLDGFRRQIGV